MNQSKQAKDSRQPSDSDTKLVSVICRTTQRPELSQALDSISQQSYPNIEVVLVDALGNGIPDQDDLRPGITVNLASTGAPLSRPAAANAGLDHASGDYLLFLDEDDWIGEDHIAKAMDFSVIDRMLKVSDADAFSLCRQLAEKEGLLAGGSAGANLWGALQIASEVNEPTTIVTVIPDGGIKYLSKIFNDHWLEQENIEITRSSHKAYSQ